MKKRNTIRYVSPGVPATDSPGGGVFRVVSALALPSCVQVFHIARFCIARSGNNRQALTKSLFPSVAAAAAASGASTIN